MVKQYCPDHGLKPFFGCCCDEGAALAEFLGICQGNPLLANFNPDFVSESIFPILEKILEKKPYWKLDDTYYFIGLNRETIYIPGYRGCSSINIGHALEYYFPEARQFLGPPDL